MIAQLDLKHCSFDRARRAISVPSEAFAGGLPNAIRVYSSHTGRTILFRPVQPGNPHFDEDQWDGMQMVYAPVEDLPRVEVLVVYHCY